MLELQNQDNPVTVSLDVVWQGSFARHDARMSEISMDGCYIDTKEQGRTIGDLVDFKVHLPGGPWVSLQGELINQDYPMGFGLRFMHLAEADRRLLSAVVVAHGGQPAEEIFIGELEVKASAPNPKGQWRVLLADDDAITLRMLTAIVESQGYQVVAVKDGREVLRILQQDTEFIAAIFDMMMPHVQGLDLILYMKRDERLRSIPVGMVTAEQDPKIWDSSVAAGASVFLPKPFTPPQVQMMLRMLLSKSIPSRSNLPQPFLMDEQMPTMGGFEATEAIRAREWVGTSRVPIVATATNAMRVDRESYMDAGMDGYVSKPVQAQSPYQEIGRMIPVSIERTGPGECVRSAGSWERAFEMEEESAFDAMAALERASGDEGLLREIARMFLDGYTRLLSNIRKAIRSRDCEAVEFAAHELIGVVSNFYAHSVSEVAQRLLVKAKRRDLKSIDSDLRTLEEEVEHLAQALKLYHDRQTVCAS